MIRYQCILLLFVMYSYYVISINSIALKNVRYSFRLLSSSSSALSRWTPRPTVPYFSRQSSFSPIIQSYLSYEPGMNCRDPLHRGLSMVSTDITPATATEDVSMKLVKKKVALVIGYVGTKYHGLQHNYENTVFVPTIEYELEKALYSAGFIRESNYQQFHKIAWGRSSRTDKGVHAQKLIISVKLEIPNIWIKDKDSSVESKRRERFPQLVERVNSFLPQDIRVFSCVKVNNGFAARNICQWREYEYLLPINAIGGSDIQNDMKKLNDALSKFLGSQTFHNFHRLQNKNVIAPNDYKVKYKSRNSDADEEVNDALEDSNDESFTSKKEQDLMELQRNLSTIYNETMQSFEVPRRYSFRSRTIAPKTYSCIYYCQAAEVINIKGQDFYRIIIRGKSFLLHQIRLMIASAVMEARGILPKYTIDLSLTAPVDIGYPLAPAEGLLLVDAGIGRMKSLTEPMAMSPQSCGYNDEDVLLDHKEIDLNNDYKIRMIYPEIQEGWNKLVTPKKSRMDQCDEDETIDDTNKLDATVPLLENWLSYIDSLKPVDPVLQAWEKMYQHTESYLANVHQLKTEKDQLRILRQTKAVLGSQSKDYRGKSSVEQVPHRYLIPDNLCTNLCVHYETVPTEMMYEVTMTIASAIIQGNIPFYAKFEDIVAFIDKNGGLKEVSTRVKHPALQ